MKANFRAKGKDSMVQKEKIKKVDLHKVPAKIIEESRSKAYTYLFK